MTLPASASTHHGSAYIWATQLSHCLMFKLLFPLALLAFAHSSFAADGRLLGTGGLLSIEGSAGGGITPWAGIAGYADTDQTGIVSAVSVVTVDDYRLRSVAVAVGAGNHTEISTAKQFFDLPDATRLGQDVFGAKLRLAGDLIYGHVPQLSLGAQFKRNHNTRTLTALGIDDRSDIDVYVSASRLYLAGPFGRSWLLNVGARSTKAWQTGLLGFGAVRSWQPEGSAVVLLNRYWAVGVEYKAKPDGLGQLSEDDWRDVFIAYFPNKTYSVAAAYVDLGEIAGRADQRGYFLSLQAQF
jgi:hypothetical protein